MRPLKTIVAGTLALLAAVPLSAQTRAAENKKPNILFIITDDHAYQTLGTGKDDSPVALPNFNKLGRQGMVFDRSYCANSLCGPSRACILTGRHSHMNGFVFNGQKPLDGSQPTYPKMLQKAGYQTGLFGKWHLESNPTGFDTWEIFPGQGSYYNPDFISLKPASFINLFMAFSYRKNACCMQQSTGIKGCSAFFAPSSSKNQSGSLSSKPGCRSNARRPSR